MARLIRALELREGHRYRHIPAVQTLVHHAIFAEYRSLKAMLDAGVRVANGTLGVA